MRILQIVPSYKPAYVYGGPIESVAKLCEGLVTQGHTVKVYTTTANGASELDVLPHQEIDVDGVGVTYFSRITKDHTHISPSLWRYLYKTVKQYDIVHIQSWWSILVIIAAIVCLRRGVKVIVSPRGMLSTYILTSGSSKAKKLIHGLVGKSVLSKTVFHATAKSEFDECTHLIPGWNGFVLPNILALPDIEIKKSESPLFTLIFLSRIHPKKGLEILFEAISRLQIGYVLKIAGSGDADYIKSLKVLATSLGIEKQVEWVGWIDRSTKFAALMEADLFVLTSQNENFANVVIESLHMGTPVLISENVALSDFVRDHDMGWVTNLHPENVKTELLKAYADLGKRKRIQFEGRKVIDQVFSEKRLVQEYANQYKNIIDKSI